MSTGLESWSAESLAKMDALYPFVGTEVSLSVLAIIIWIGWHIWQFKSENRTYEDQSNKIKGNLEKAITGD